MGVFSVAIKEKLMFEMAKIVKKNICNNKPINCLTFVESVMYCIVPCPAVSDKKKRSSALEHSAVLQHDASVPLVITRTLIAHDSVCM